MIEFIVTEGISLFNFPLTNIHSLSLNWQRNAKKRGSKYSELRKYIKKIKNYNIKFDITIVITMKLPNNWRYKSIP